jgi:hypothetical protein
LARFHVGMCVVPCGHVCMYVCPVCEQTREYSRRHQDHVVRCVLKTAEDQAAPFRSMCEVRHCLSQTARAKLPTASILSSRTCPCSTAFRHTLRHTPIHPPPKTHTHATSHPTRNTLTRTMKHRHLQWARTEGGRQVRRSHGALHVHCVHRDHCVCRVVCSRGGG